MSTIYNKYIIICNIHIKLQELITKKNLKKSSYKENPSVFLYKEILDLKREINCLQVKLKNKNNSNLKYEIKI